jgi:hypothetical protein
MTHPIQEPKERRLTEFERLIHQEAGTLTNISLFPLLEDVDLPQPSHIRDSLRGSGKVNVEGVVESFLLSHIGRVLLLSICFLFRL